MHDPHARPGPPPGGLPIGAASVLFTFYALDPANRILDQCEAENDKQAQAILGVACPSLAAVQSKLSYELGRDRPRRRNNDDEDDGA